MRLFFHNVCKRLFPVAGDVVVCQPIKLLKRIETGLYPSSKCIWELSVHPATPSHISYTRKQRRNRRTTIMGRFLLTSAVFLVLAAAGE